MKTKQFSILLFVLSAFCFVAGCQKNEFGTSGITGTVLVDGAPMEGVSISFVPKGSGSRECYGMTDAQGKFKLTIPGTEVGSGAIPGEYDVTFSKTVSVAEGMTEEEIAKKYPNSLPPTKSVLPDKYNDRAKTDIAPVKVEKGKKNDFTFELFSK